MRQRSVAQLIKSQNIHLAPSASVREAAKLMSETAIGALLVMDEGRLAGIFPARDAINRVRAAGALGRRLAVSVPAQCRMML